MAPCVFGSILVCVFTRPSLCTKAPKAVTPGLCEEEIGPWPCAARRVQQDGMGGRSCLRRPWASSRKCSSELCTIKTRSWGICEFLVKSDKWLQIQKCPQGLAGNLDG